MAEAVRRCVADRLANEERLPSRRERIREALAVCGKYRDPRGASDVATNHDRYLADAFGR